MPPSVPLSSRLAAPAAALTPMLDAPMVASPAAPLPAAPAAGRRAPLTRLVRLALAGLFAGGAALAALPAAAGNAGPYLAAEQAARRGDVAAAATFYAQALAGDPENLALMDRAITQQIAAGRLEAAVALSRKMLGVEPQHHLGALLLAADALRQRDPAAARGWIAADDPEAVPFVARLIDAWAIYGQGDAAAARAALETLETSAMGGPAGQLVAAYHLGLLAAASGDDATAAGALDRAAERAGTGTLRLARVRAGVLARLGRVEEARALIAGRLKQTLGDRRLEAEDALLAAGQQPQPLVQSAEQGAAEALYGVAGFLARGENRIVGLAYARIAAWLSPDLVEANLLVAEMLREDGQHDLAIAAFEAVPSDVPEAMDALIGRAAAIEAAGRTDDAIAALRDVTARFPRTVEAHTALGDLLRRAERFADAGAAYDAGIALIAEPEQRHWPLFYQRGIAFERSKQWARAEEDFHRALALEPDQPLVLNYLGYSWVEMGVHLEEARRMIERAVEQRPEDGYIVDSLGWVLYRTGDFTGAVEHLETAVELRPVDPVINDHFGDALWMVGRQVEAEFQWRRALSFEPEEKDALRIRRKLAEGLDRVLADEAAAGTPAILGRDGTPTPPTNDGG